MGLVGGCGEARIDGVGSLAVGLICSWCPAGLYRLSEMSELHGLLITGWQTCKGSSFGAFISPGRGAEHAQIVLADPSRPGGYYWY